MFNPDNLTCELLDAGGAAVREHKTTENERSLNERRRPTNCWVTLPDSSALRLRVNPCCAGYEKDFGLLIPLSDKAWLVKAEDPGDYFLSGTFSVSPPPDNGRVNAWHGRLKLPKTKVTLNAGKGLPTSHN